MQFKKTSLATAVIVSIALAGCGSDSNSDNKPTDPPNPPEASQGVFIDAAVEGLYYVSEPSGKKGFTDAEGKFEFESDDLVTFFLGGENGLRIGKVSARDVVSPFEATGNYQKALNLARILQSAGNTTQETITLPESLIAPDGAMISALNNVMLHDLDSSDALKQELGIDEWVSEADALDHLNNSLKDLERGSNEILTDWSKGSGKVLREVSSSLSAKSEGMYDDLFIHADKLLDRDIFEQVNGTKSMTFSLNESGLVIAKGSNDTVISGSIASGYLTCLDLGGEFGFSGSEYTCNGSSLQTSPKFSLLPGYDYSIVDPLSSQSNDDEMEWEGEDGEELRSFGGIWPCIMDGDCSEKSLTKFSIVKFDDSDEQDGSEELEDILSASYDSVTGIYTEVKSRIHLSGPYQGRQSESISFTYVVDGVDSERYVDFVGEWRTVGTKVGCDNVAVSQFTFDDQGVVITGEEFSGQNCETAEFNEQATYAELAEMDYWWFTTNDVADSKATLAQLNTTVRWCDADGDIIGQCDTNDEKINRWEYVPAGANWDQGTLNRRTLDNNGNVMSTESMYKL